MLYFKLHKYVKTAENSIIYKIYTVHPAEKIYVPLVANVKIDTPKIILTALIVERQV